MSGPTSRNDEWVSGHKAKNEQGRPTVADWEGFDVEGRLGVGTSGTVWLARQLSVGRLVALKELAPELANDQTVREHLRHEARVLARLDHPNCVAVYSYLESASSAAIVMEFVQGVSLRTLTEQSPLSVEQALSVLEGALSGLAAAHQQGIVHGDIKPDNILLSISGESKLVDFGLAAAVGTRRAPGTGSPTYSSPEAAAGEPLGVASDLYSVGLVLAELLAGVAPISADPAAVAASAPAPVASLVRRALDPDPSARQASALAFLDELRAAAEAGCGEDWRRRAVLVPIVAAAATGAASALGVAKAGAATLPNETTSSIGTARRASKIGHLLHAHPWAAAAMAGVVVVAGVGAGVAAASGGGKAPPPPTPTSIVKPATASGTEPTVMTAAQFEDATLPAGICTFGETDPNAPPIPMTDGHGHAGYWYAGILGTPTQVNFGSGHQGIAASILCSQGGSSESSEVWVFGGTPTNMAIDFGPVPQRSYAVGSYGVDFNDTQSTNVRSVGHSMVVSETYGGADVCSDSGGICPALHNSTTWSWSRTTPDRLVITNPVPVKTVTLVSSVPTGIAGDELSGRMAQAPLQLGQSVLVVCANTQVAGSQGNDTWFEINTGNWLPATDLKPVEVPDCDATTRSGPATTTTRAGGVGAAASSSHSTAPCTPATLTSAAQAAGGEGNIDPAGYGCSGDWAYAGVALENGQEEVTWIFQSIGGVWHRAIVQTDCANQTSTPAVPQSILQADCNSN